MTVQICVLCARRKPPRYRQADHGAVCGPCRTRLDDHLADLVRLAADAAAWVEPRPSGIGARVVPGSRPPLNVEALEPEMILVKPWSGDPDDLDCAEEIPLLVLLESWERIIRSERGFAPYGLASEARADHDNPNYAGAEVRPDPSYGAAIIGHPKAATLTGVVEFLRSQLDWIVSRDTFGLEQFADEVAACWRALLRYDAEREGALTWRVECPADVDGGLCGKGLRIAGDDLDRDVTCPRCRTRWDVHRLLLVGIGQVEGHMWLDAESITLRTGVDRKTLDRWVREGRIEKSHGRYDARPILANQRGMSA